MSISGNSVRRGSAICSWRVASKLAASASVASLSTSDGWKLHDPTVTHARAPLIVDAQARRERQHHPDRGEDRDRNGERPPAAVRHPDRDEHAGRARSRPTSADARRSDTASCPCRPRSPPTTTAPSPGRASRTRRRPRRSRSTRREVVRARPPGRRRRGCARRGGIRVRSLQPLERGLPSLGDGRPIMFWSSARNGSWRGMLVIGPPGPGRDRRGGGSKRSSRAHTFQSARRPAWPGNAVTSSTVTSTRSATKRRKWSPRAP